MASRLIDKILFGVILFEDEDHVQRELSSSIQAFFGKDITKLIT